MFKNMFGKKKLNGHVLSSMADILVEDYMTTEYVTTRSLFIENVSKACSGNNDLLSIVQTVYSCLFYKVREEIPVVAHNVYINDVDKPVIIFALMLLAKEKYSTDKLFTGVAISLTMSKDTVNLRLFLEDLIERIKLYENKTTEQVVYFDNRSHGGSGMMLQSSSPTPVEVVNPFMTYPHYLYYFDVSDDNDKGKHYIHQEPQEDFNTTGVREAMHASHERHVDFEYRDDIGMQSSALSPSLHRIETIAQAMHSKPNAEFSHRSVETPPSRPYSSSRSDDNDSSGGSSYGGSSGSSYGGGSSGSSYGGDSGSSSDCGGSSDSGCSSF